MVTNRVWARADSTGLPGVMRIFLDDGTLVMDSCWETHRLARWQRESDSTLRWQEDAADIRATIRSLTVGELVMTSACAMASRPNATARHGCRTSVPT